MALLFVLDTVQAKAITLVISGNLGRAFRGPIRRGSRKTVTALLAGMSTAAGLWGCAPPIQRGAGERAVRATLCPACPTIENPPPGYCPCTEGWVCRETPEAAAARREQQRRREESVARREESARRHAEAVARERARAVVENNRRRTR